MAEIMPACSALDWQFYSHAYTMPIMLVISITYERTSTRLAALSVSDSGDGTVSLLLGNGDGTLQSAADDPAGLAPSSAILTDVNGDRRPDLIVVNVGGAGVRVLLGRCLP